MNIKETKEFLNNSGIYQLRHGESLADAISSTKNGTSRKGYQVKADNGRSLSENEIIQASNKEAFMKFTPAEYSHDEVGSIDDIPDSDDLRENKKQRGCIANCFYCGTCIRVDGDGDYEITEPEVHCEDCIKDAISRLAM